MNTKIYIIITIVIIIAIVTSAAMAGVLHEMKKEKRDCVIQSLDRTRRAPGCTSTACFDHWAADAALERRRQKCMR